MIIGAERRAELAGDLADPDVYRRLSSVIASEITTPDSTPRIGPRDVAVDS